MHLLLRKSSVICDNIQLLAITISLIILHCIFILCQSPQLVVKFLELHMLSLMSLKLSYSYFLVLIIGEIMSYSWKINFIFPITFKSHSCLAHTVITYTWDMSIELSSLMQIMSMLLYSNSFQFLQIDLIQ